eukprot:14416443-Alexandrium_andersonii.AAC.1
MLRRATSALRRAGAGATAMGCHGAVNQKEVAITSHCQVLTRQQSRCHWAEPVSYTHLTLPTICSV